MASHVVAVVVCVASLWRGGVVQGLEMVGVFSELCSGTVLMRVPLVSPEQAREQALSLVQAGLWD